MKTALIPTAMAALCALPVSAETVTLDYSAFGGNCTVNEAETDQLTYTTPGCSLLPLVVIEGAEGATPGAVIEAKDGVRFDLLGLDVVWSFPELLSVAASDLPADFDPDDPADYDAIFAQNLWQTLEYENFRISGYRDGTLVAEEYYTLVDSNAYLNPGDGSRSLPNTEAPFSGVFTNLDRIEFGNATGFEDAIDFGLAAIGDRYYTCLGTCGYVVIDDVSLSVNSTIIPDPTPSPVPTPAGLPLLLGALALMGGTKFKRSRTHGDVAHDKV